VKRTNSRGMSGHQQPNRGKSDTWLTPPKILQSLGKFDLDPCVPFFMPWQTAERSFTEFEDGLWQQWEGRVWLNCPYGPECEQWLEKLARHGRGTALIFARTETAAWFDHVWGVAHAVSFLKGRLHFHDAAGNRAPFNSGAPSALVAYGQDDARQLWRSGLGGKFVRLRGELNYMSEAAA
jgi:hypothetical protein